MKNSFAKRWLPVLLVLAICLSLAPAAFAVGPTVTVTPASFKLAPGEKQQMTVAVDGVTSPAVTWLSGSPDIATVDSNTGEVTAIKDGTAKIIAIYGQGAADESRGEAQCTVETPAATDTIVFSVSPKTASVEVGKTQSLTASLTKNGSAQTASVTWESSDLAKAVLDQNGVVTGVAAGSVTITAKCIFEGKEYSDTAAVTVTPAPVEPSTIRKVSPNTNSITIEKGSTGGQNITVVPSPADAEVKWKFSYTDSDGKTQESTTSDIVSLSGSGTTVRVTGQKPGRVDVIAYVGDGTGADQSVKLEVVVSGIVVDTSTIELKENERKKLPVPEVYGAAAVGGGPRFQANDSYIASVISDEVVGYTIGETQRRLQGVYPHQSRRRPHHHHRGGDHRPERHPVLRLQLYEPKICGTAQRQGSERYRAESLFHRLWYVVLQLPG